MTREALDALLQRQQAQLAALKARVEVVEARLGGHSQNSQRPRRATGLHAAAQLGHRGQILAMTATPDAIITPHPCQCAYSVRLL